MNKLDAPSLADRAYDAVEAEIVSLRLEPGAVISEATLCELLGIGRTPTREGLKRLEAGGLLRVLPRRGMIVAPIDMVDFLALLQTRRVLDRLTVQGAVQRATAEDRGRLSEVARAMEDAAATGDVRAFVGADRQAGRILAPAAGNPYAARAVAPLHTHCRRFWMRYGDTGDVTRSAMLHGLMLEAVTAGDEEAAARASDGLVDYLEHLTRTILQAA